MISGGGLFLQLEQPLAPETEVKVRFRPAKSLPNIEAKGKVRYSVPPSGVAIEFTEIDPEHRSLLLGLIHRKTGDKRLSPRTPLATQIQSNDRMSLALSRDVSLGGMFIETKQPLPIGSRFQLRFNLEDRGPAIQADAEVVYQVAKLGMGVQFVQLTPADVKRLEVHIAKSPIIAQPSTPVTKAN